jgi:hypothetical protein
LCLALYLITICFAPSLSDSFIFLTLTRLVVVLKFINFRFALFTPPPLGNFQYSTALTVYSFGITVGSLALCVIEADCVASDAEEDPVPKSGTTVGSM